jgi:hypothetical protein
MDFKTLGSFIVVLGLALLLWGGLKYGSNRPVGVNTRGMDYLQAVGAGLNAMDENVSRQQARESGAKVLAAGAIVAFIGLGVIFAARKRSA